MRPYTGLLISISLGSIVAVMACSTKHSSGGFVVGTSSTDLGNGNTSNQQQTTTYNQSGGGAQAVVQGSGSTSEIKQQAVTGGTGGTRGGPTGTFTGFMLAAAAAGLRNGTQNNSILQGPGSARLSAGELLSFTSDATGATITPLGLPASFSDGTITWGRWGYNPYQVVQTLSTYQITSGGSTTPGPVGGGAFHFVTGAPTPVSNLPASGTARYNLLGTTHPTTNSTAAADQDRNRFLSGSLAVLWGGAASKIGVDFVVGVNQGGVASTFNVVSNGGLDNPGSSQLGLVTGTSSFAGVVNATPSDAGACNFLNASSCKTDIAGFFAGNNAERAGLTYAIHSTGTNGIGDIQGAATFTTGPIVPGTPTLTLLSQTNPVTVSITGGPDISSFTPADTADVTQNADLSLSRINYSTGIFTVTRGTTASADVGGDQFITWGRWVGGQAAGNVFGSAPAAMPGNASLHYIAGIPTPSAALPASGTATFSLLGATSPTFGNGVGGPGTVTSAMMAVAWGGAASTKVGLDMSVSMPGDQAYRIQTLGGLATPSTSQIHTLAGPNFFGSVGGMPATGRACTGGGCTADVNGFFAGPAAQRAGITYTISNGASANGIFGAAVFGR